MDESLLYLMEAQTYIDSFEEVSLSDYFFEAETADVNKAAKTGAINALKKAISKLIQAVKDMMTRLVDFFKSQFMSKDEKARYKEFKKMIKEDPELSKMVVTIVDFREYEKLYDEALKALEAESKKPSPSQEIAKKIMDVLDDKISKLKGDVEGAANRAMLSVTLSTAVDICDKNTDAAKVLNFALKNELISLQDVEKELGSAEAARFEKKIEKLSKKGWLHQMRIKVFHRKQSTLTGVLKHQMNNLMSFTNIKNGKVRKGRDVVDTRSILRGVSKNPKLVIDTAGSPAEAGKFAKSAIKAKMDAKRYEKKAKKFIKNVDNDLRFLGVKK